MSAACQGEEVADSALCDCACNCVIVYLLKNIISLSSICICAQLWWKSEHFLDFMSRNVVYEEKVKRLSRCRWHYNKQK